MSESRRETGEAILASLPATTGRTPGEWVQLVRDHGPDSRIERVAWLRHEHGLDMVTANAVVDEAERLAC